MRKGALFVTEKFAFKQFLRYCPTVDGYKGLVSPAAVGVKGAHQQFLASSRFTSYKHSAVRGRNLAEDLEDFSQACALADNAAGIQLHVCISACISFPVSIH